MLVPGLEHARHYRIMSIVLDDSGQFHPLIPFPHPASATHICYRSRKTKSDCSCWLRFWSFAKCFSSTFLAPPHPHPRGSTNFSGARNAPTAFPEVTHQGALGAPSSGNAARPAGVFKSAGAAAQGAAAGFLVGRAGTWGERPPPACASPFLRRDASEITRSSGRAGPWGGGIPGE